MKSKSLLLISVWLLVTWMALTTPAPAQNTVPGEPTGVAAAPGNASAAVSFNPPASYGGSAITGYTVKTGDGTTTAAGTGSPIVVRGLANGTAYTFTVTATNANGAGPPSEASNSVTPSATWAAASAGTWNQSFLAAGTDAPWGRVCTETSNADGTFSGSCTDSNGNAGNYAGVRWLFPYGVIPILNGVSPVSNILCYGDVSNTVATCTGTFPDGSPLLWLGTRQGASYSMPSDLPGKWRFESLDIAQGASKSGNAGITIESNGNFQATGSEKGSLTGTFSLSSDGRLNWPTNDPAFEGFMNAGKTVMAGNSGVHAYPGEDVELDVFVKAASSYSLADLAGLLGRQSIVLGREVDKNEPADQPRRIGRGIRLLQ